TCYKARITGDALKHIDGEVTSRERNYSATEGSGTSLRWSISSHQRSEFILRFKHSRTASQARSRSIASTLTKTGARVCASCGASALTDSFTKSTKINA